MVQILSPAGWNTMRLGPPAPKCDPNLIDYLTEILRLYTPLLSLRAIPSICAWTQLIWLQNQVFEIFFTSGLTEKLKFVKEYNFLIPMGHPIMVVMLHLSRKKKFDPLSTEEYRGPDPSNQAQKDFHQINSLSKNMRKASMWCVSTRADGMLSKHCDYFYSASHSILWTEQYIPSHVKKRLFPRKWLNKSEVTRY